MASIHIRGKKGTFTAFWRDGDGLMKCRSTRERNKEDAQAIADAWEKLDKLRPEEVTEKQFHKVSGDIFTRITNQKLERWTVKSFASKWLQDIKPDLAPSSYYSYATAINEFAGDPAFTTRSLRQIDRDGVIAYREELRKTGKAKGTINKRMKIIKAMFTAAKIDKLITENPMEHVKRIKQRSSDSQQPGAFDIDQLKAVLEACDDEWRSMTIHGYYTGQRLGDIAKMLPEYFDLKRRQVRMVTGKTGQLVIVEMPPAYLKFCEEQLKNFKPGQPLHPQSHRTLAQATEGERERTSTLSNRFTRILEKAKLRPKTSHAKKEGGQGRSAPRERVRLSYHSLRHSLVSHLSQAGVSRSLVQDIVGHENEAVNVSYTHFDSATKLDAMKKLPDITG